MNKTININLAGIIFHVDEDAYSYFNTYLQSVKAQFDNAEEREEMTTRLFTYVIPRKSKDLLYVAFDRELAKAGIVNERYRSKRKGDLFDFDEKEEL